MTEHLFRDIRPNFQINNDTCFSYRQIDTEKTVVRTDAKEPASRVEVGFMRNSDMKKNGT